MRAYEIERFGDPDGLVVTDREVSEPGHGEVLVRVRAASLNYRDLMILDEVYPFRAEPGTIPLSDGAGEVVSVGDGVRNLAVGDRVTSTYFPYYTRGPLSIEQLQPQFGVTLDGLLAEYRVLHEDWVVPAPEHLSFEEAATLPCAALTAWSALTGPTPVRFGDTVLTLGTGGVALFATQLAVALGARVIGATSTQAKAELLRGLGAHEVIDYSATPDWARAVAELTGGRGVDHVVETVGPATLTRSINAVALDGHITVVGGFGVTDGTIDPAAFAVKPFTLRRIAVGGRDAFVSMNELITRIGLRPVIDRTHDFEDARGAYRRLANREHVGKIVIGWS